MAYILSYQKNSVICEFFWPIKDYHFEGPIRLKHESTFLIVMGFNARVYVKEKNPKTIGRIMEFL